MYRYRIPITVACLLVTLLGSRWAGQTPVAPIRQTDELSLLAIPFNDWVELEFDLRPAEAATIRPAAALMRQYESPHGESVELTVIVSGDRRNVHVAQDILPGNGFDTESEQFRTLALPDRQIPVTQTMLVDTEGRRMIALDFFTDGSYATNSITRYHWHQMMRRLRGETDPVALVRVAVPLAYGPERAEALANEFARTAVPKVLKALRKMKQKA